MQAERANIAGSPVVNLAGSLVAMATPFLGCVVDELAFSRLCERQIDEGSTALVVCGSTGEGPALSIDEQARIVAVAAEAASGRLPVIAGCGGPSTEAAITLAVSAARSGATGLLCAPPPYVKPTQEGIVAHIRAIAHAANWPVILYDVPSRTSVGISDATVARLFESGLVVALKDATADLARVSRLRALCGSAFVQLSGDDATALAYRAMGGHGCISVTANVAPTLCALGQAAWDRREWNAVEPVRDLLAPLHEALFLESNPIPLKAAMKLISLCSDDVRLPLTRATSATRNRLAAVLPEVLKAEESWTGRPRLRVVK